MKPVKLIKARGGTMDVFGKRAALLAPPPPPPPTPKDDTSSAVEDTLDAFLAELNGSDGNAGSSAASIPAQPLEQSEAGEGFVAHLDAAYDGDDSGFGERELLYDSDGDVVGVAPGAGPVTKKSVAPLPSVDHSKVSYAPFERCFYAPVSEVSAMTPEDIAAARTACGITVSGADGIAPVESFMHLCLDGTHPALIAALAQAGYEAPTGIQSQVLPALLSGRDVIGVAETGSGKTLAFALPVLRHVAAQRPIGKGDGPVALILAPTRELAAQVAAEVRRFAKAINLQVALLSGGSSQWEQTQALRAGAAIVVATPGRLIDHVRGKSTNLSRVTFLVIDEADRLFEMGFQQQVYSILGQVRPDRQTAMFSATFRGKVERLAASATRSPVRIVVGVAGQSASAVTQHFHVLSHASKWGTLTSVLPPLLREGKVVVFVSGKAAAEELAVNLNAASVQLAPHLLPLSGSTLPSPFAVSLHGDKLQSERDAALAAFKRQPSTAVLVATDLAARGLHVASVAGVINFDAAKNADTHVHRIGRTGRIGADGAPMPGTAHTFIMPHESGIAAALTRNLQLSGTPVPDALLSVARKHASFSDAAAGGPRRDGKFDGGNCGPGPRASAAVNTGLGFGDAGNEGPPPPPMQVRGLQQQRNPVGGAGAFVRAATSSSSYATGTLTGHLGNNSGPRNSVEYDDPESAAAAGAAAWARLNSLPSAGEGGALAAAAAAAALAESVGVPAWLAPVIEAARAARTEGRAVDSESLSAVAAAAAAADAGEGDEGEGDDCLEGDEADMTRLRRKRVSRYASGAPGSERAAAAAELGGQLRTHMAQSFSTSFTSGGVYGGEGRGGTSGVAVASAPPAAPPVSGPPATAAAGSKRSRWSEGPPPPAAAAAVALDPLAVTERAHQIERASGSVAGEGGTVKAESGGEGAPAPPARTSRFGPPVPAAAAQGATPASVPQPQQLWQLPLAGFVAPGRALYIPGVRY